ncbi:putative ARID DNA-binding domain superfamily [Helianthus anomalus]
MVVKRDGGHKKVTRNNTCDVVAKDVGFDYDNNYMMRLIYVIHLYVLEYYL